jgi:hypothetical protein
MSEQDLVSLECYTMLGVVSPLRDQDDSCVVRQLSERWRAKTSKTRVKPVEGGFQNTY